MSGLWCSFSKRRERARQSTFVSSLDVVLEIDSARASKTLGAKVMRRAGLLSHMYDW